MNWILVIAGGIWIYCVLFAGAFFITSNTLARQRTRRVKKMLQRELEKELSDTSTKWRWI
jgi:hypothetical protein